MRRSDVVSSTIYVCPLCALEARGEHRCRPLNNLESWALGRLRMKLIARRSGT